MQTTTTTIDPLTAAGIHEPVSLRELSREALIEYSIYLRRENERLSGGLKDANGETTRLQQKMTELVGRAS